jgi:hypothetical protein
MTGGQGKARSWSVKLDTMGAPFVNRGFWNCACPIQPIHRLGIAHEIQGA